MFIQTLENGLQALQLPSPTRPLSDFERFYHFLLEWNQRINLTRIQEEQEFIEKHLLDSLLVAQFIPNQSTVIDIGSGAGFPGIPLALYRNDLRVILVESIQKKATFLRAAIAELALDQVEVWNTYLEARTIVPMLKNPPLPLRERAGVRGNITCVTRATHAPDKILSLCLPLLKTFPQTRVLLMQGPKSEGKIDAATDKIVKKHTLSATVHGPVKLPWSGAERFVIEIF